MVMLGYIQHGYFTKHYPCTSSDIGFSSCIRLSAFMAKYKLHDFIVCDTAPRFSVLLIFRLNQVEPRPKQDCAIFVSAMAVRPISLITSRHDSLHGSTKQGCGG